MKKLLFWFIILLVATASVFASGEAETDVTTITFGDVSWDSVQVHNRIMAFIIENGLEGYEAEFIPGDTLPILNGLTQGDIDVDMESWHSNFMEVYEKAIASGSIIDLGQNMPDAPQAWWIPRYLVEGPDAVAPDLKSITDLPKYAHLFTDPEDKSKGLIYGGVAGWNQLTLSEKMFEENNLGDTFNLGVAGSSAALAGTMVGAYTKGEAWVGYYWAPTAVLGKLDMVALEGTYWPEALVNILVNSDMPEKAPEVVEILKKYHTSVADNNDFLSAMDDDELTIDETAIWFLENKEEVWSDWVSADVKAKVKSALASR
ncbi:MAG: glycine betaine ABC transporter substrate-binding protein [Sphaerochaetaceae bacterium]